MKHPYNDITMICVGVAGENHTAHRANIEDLYARLESLQGTVSALQDKVFGEEADPPHPCTNLKPGDPVMVYERKGMDAMRRKYIEVTDVGFVRVEDPDGQVSSWAYGMPSDQWDKEVLGCEN